MRNRLFKIGEAALIMFAVGALLALAAPHIAVAIGIAPTLEVAVQTLGHTADPLWLASFFGGFGGIHAAIAPICENVLEGKSKKAQQTPQPATAETAVQVAQAQAVETAVAEETCPHCEKLAAQRAAQDAQPSVAR